MFFLQKWQYAWGNGLVADHLALFLGFFFSTSKHLKQIEQCVVCFLSIVFVFVKFCKYLEYSYV